jgi:hypothetical protein
MNQFVALQKPISPVAVAVALTVLTATAAADSAPPAKTQRPVDGIMDNSFLVEEAYNQEPGVVQHILTAFYGVNRLRGPDDKLWSPTFTQEWPLFSQRHQFSYTMPYYFLESGGRSTDGFGDVLLNYRYQAYFKEESLRGFAPRASLVLPTGRKGAGFSDDTIGAQFNLPFSSAWGERWFTHFNAGLTWLPDSFNARERDALHYNLGASVIYAATSDIHLMLEWTGGWFNAPDSGNGLRHEFVSLISPGVRKAFNFANDSQLVIGVAAPIGLTGASPDFGVFLYLSFEHFFKK